MRYMIYIFISMFLFVGCASGTNPYFTNKNVGIALGGGAGAYGVEKQMKKKGGLFGDVERRKYARWLTDYFFEAFSTESASKS